MEMRRHRGLPTGKSDLSTMKWKFLFFLFFFFTFVIISATCYGLNCVLPEFTSSPNPQCDGHRAFRAVTQVKGGHKAGLVMFDPTGLMSWEQEEAAVSVLLRAHREEARRGHGKETTVCESESHWKADVPAARSRLPASAAERKAHFCCWSAQVRSAWASQAKQHTARGPRQPATAGRSAWSLYRASPDTSCASGIVSVARDAAEN